MARSPKPWFREDRQAWFVTINGERHNLGPDEKQARRKFHELMAAPEPKPAPRQPNGTFTVADIYDKFLDWSQKHCAAKTYQWLHYRIQMFVDALASAVEMPVAALKPYHISEWLDQHAGWSGNYRRGFIRAIQQPFNWAVKFGYIEASPIRHIEKPPATRREQVITPEEWPAIRDR